VNKTHRYFGNISATRRITLPKALAITRHQKKLVRLLEFHGIRHAILNRPSLVRAKELELDNAPQCKSEKHDNDATPISIVERTVSRCLAPDDLWIDLSQPMGRIAALILDPRSEDTIFRRQPYREMLEKEAASFVVPVLQEL
jgi:hypothetical protein